VTKVTPEKKAKFLSVLANGGSVTLAARAIGVARNNVYAWRNKDEQFKADWDDAVEQGTDMLEDAAVERAIKGKSDTMIIFLLKSRRKEKYAERTEHTGKGGGPITLKQWMEQHSGKTLGPPSERGKEVRHDR
jgi:transposase-like protein